MSDSVTVTGHGAAAGVPDRAVIEAGASGHRQDPAELLAMTAARIAAAVERLDALGIGPRDRQTSGLSLVRREDSGTPGGYSGTRRLQVTCRDLDQVGPVIDALAQAAGDALVIHDLRLEIADPVSLTDQARERAFADAERRARQLAELAGRQLGEVERVVEGGRHDDGPILSRAMLASAPMEAGTQTVECALTVTWRLR